MRLDSYRPSTSVIDRQHEIGSYAPGKVQAGGMTGKKVPILTKLAYGFGAIAYGVKNNGFDFFLLLFYSQILGVKAELVGLALLIALVFDAFSDPFVGYLSDNTRSRWGRRHPWMYFAAVPVSIAYFFLWAPPEGLSGNMLFLYLVVLSILIRTLITLYEVPSSALAPELTRDYDERTSLMAWRTFFGWIGGTLIAAFTLAVILAPSESNPGGLFNRDGFATYGLIASVMIFGSIMIASLGTHRLIPNLPKAPERESKKLRQMFGEIFETLTSKSFFALFLATILSAVATGLAMSLNLYLNSYFWGFTQEQISILILASLVGATASVVVAPLFTKKFGKRKGAVIAATSILFMSPVLIALRLLGVLEPMPADGHSFLLPLIFVIATIEMTLTITFQVLMFSMIADLVEESEVKTRRRSEGVFFAAITFSAKATQGLGIFAASLVLSLVSFPEGAAPGEVPDSTVLDFGKTYLIAILALWILRIFCVRLYKIDRAAHERNVAEATATS
jgi:GPH family glycoside/pentoside/hexuronide:cation symporter